MNLDSKSPIPLYIQLKEILKQEISHRDPHTAIASEPRLVAQYHVSRLTVQQAIRELVHEGMLYRRHGCGTFVRDPHDPEQRLHRIEQAARLAYEHLSHLDRLGVLTREEEPVISALREALAE